MRKNLLHVITFLFAGFVILLSCKKEITPKKGNKSPVGVAGPDQVITLPTDSILLDGSSSGDPDGTISNLLWTKISGPASFTINSATTAKTVVKNLTVGTYQFELKVTDDGGLSAKDSVQVVVNDPTQHNRPPVANAGVNQTIALPANTVNLDGSGSSDPDNNISNYLWKKISGPSAFNIVSINAEQTQIINLTQGLFLLELEVTDSGGLSSKDTVHIVVLDTVNCDLQTSYEIIVTLPIDSVFIDDYFRDDEGTCVVYLCGPATGTVEGGWIKNLIPGVYFFRRYWRDCTSPAEIIKVTVLDDPNERNTITYKNLIWEYNCAWTTNTNNNCQHLFLARPKWPSPANSSIETTLQIDSLNNGDWFPVPSNTGGFNFFLNCEFTLNNCFQHFVVKVSPENSSWDGKRANLKIKVL